MWKVGRSEVVWETDSRLQGGVCFNSLREQWYVTAESGHISLLRQRTRNQINGNRFCLLAFQRLCTPKPEFMRPCKAPDTYTPEHTIEALENLLREQPVLRNCVIIPGPTTLVYNVRSILSSITSCCRRPSLTYRPFFCVVLTRDNTNSPTARRTVCATERER